MTHTSTTSTYHTNTTMHHAGTNYTIHHSTTGRATYNTDITQLQPLLMLILVSY